MVTPLRMELSVQIQNDGAELQSLLEAIYQKYGYDFRHYSKASIRRRILQRFSRSNLSNIAALQNKLLRDQNFFHTLLMDFSINVTEMFRDPSFYLALRQTIIPILRTYPIVRIWNAGCSSGEEIYSTAILLEEEGLLYKSLIYATDFNEVILQKAREGVFPLERMKVYTRNYQLAGGKESFANYYSVKREAAFMDNKLKKNIIFSTHNLASDGIFGEMHLIMCRNVLIYFDKELQNRVIGLFHESLIRRGILCLGGKESIRFSQYNRLFDELIPQEKIYQKTLK
jgi:chemotaxis protein methyltransferase CheR